MSMPTENLKTFRQNLKKDILSGNKISFRFGVKIGNSETKLKSIINHILNNYDQSELIPVAYACTKELVENGLKANVKRIYFNELGLDLKDKKNYQKGMSSFREILLRKKFENYLSKAHKAGLYVDVEFKHSSKGINVNVRNNVGLTKIEHKRIRRKMKEALQYKDLVQCYLNEKDEAEGSGIGLTLIILLLKDQKIPPGKFRITSDKGNTTRAEFEIPFGS